MTAAVAWLDLPTILLVDDQKSILELLRLTFDGVANTILSSDADSAWTHILAHKPDGLLLDIMMPGSMDGLALCRKIKAAPDLCSIYINLISCRGQKADVENGLAAGADDYTIKPCSPAALRAKTMDMLLLNRLARS